MKRWYVCPLLPPEPPLAPGATEGEVAAHKPWYRLKVSGAVPRYEAIIPTDPVTGIPRFGWGLAMVDAPDFASLDADTQMIGFPRIGLDATLGEAFTTAQLLTWRNRLLAQGIDLTGITRSSTMRELLRRVGRQLETTFDEDLVRG